MPQANVEIAKRVIDGFNRRDLDAMFECVNQDVEWLPAMPVTAGAGALRGGSAQHAAVRVGRRDLRRGGWPHGWPRVVGALGEE